MLRQAVGGDTRVAVQHEAPREEGEGLVLVLFLVVMVVDVGRDPVDEPVEPFVPEPRLG